ncbi:MAG TPA: nucleotide exchange factor GrpE [Planctomycetes bacterium]|nr:nucleotide exchange factor GrpE [Planctomycetota bacterium]
MNNWPNENQILDTFRDWLQQTRAEAGALGEDGPLAEGPVDARPVGLFQLAEVITALRHEVKLGTKGARNLEEQVGTVLGALEQAIQQFRSVEPKQRAAAVQAAKPFVEALIDLDEALRRGQAVIEKARQKLVEQIEPQAIEEIRRARQKQGWLKRRLTQGAFRRAEELVRRQCQRIREEMFEPLLAGYQLILNRLHRAMKEQEIYRMQCVGKPVDPNAMTVLEVIEDPTGPPGLVTEEVRAGYYWKAKPFRYAEVRAIRGEPSEQG